MEVKGTAVVSVPKFIEGKFGKEGLAGWFGSLSEEARKVYETGVLATEWYPMESIFLQPVQKLCDLFYKGDLKGAWESGCYSAEYALKGIYKVFVRLGSPQWLIARASTIMSTYYRPGAMQVVEEAEKMALVRITEMTTCHPIVEQRIAGWIHRALEISGCASVEVRVSPTPGGAGTDFLATWL